MCAPLQNHLALKLSVTRTIIHPYTDLCYA